ncbi:uncharacterized protein LOC124672046 [Lolium rigidum]|uniref:uncharacterized protein LOC124672046 n=2 Tax=Lolium rigidum TaxID=89674 RepID=UPI001F5C485B|nr:uncharacterized protein LOC124672046 [Lolium rigidum]
MAAKKQKEKRDQRAIDEKKRLAVVKMQKRARDKRARDRGKLSKERQVSGNSSPRTPWIIEMVELNRLWSKQAKDFDERYGHPDPVTSDRSFVEKAFGSTNVDCDDSLASSIVSLALFDAFENNRNRADRLRIKVLLPRERNIHIDGFLGLYDKDIAIVTCFYCSDPRSVNLDAQVQHLSDHDSVVALGRAFNSGTLMSVEGQRIHVVTTDGSERALIYNCTITEAGLGGPVIDKDGHFLGLNIDCDTNTKRTSILPWQLLRERLQYFEKYTPNSTNFRAYTLPEDLFSIVPSGHWNTVNYLTSMGYPKPPPLVLEIGGSLCNKFEEKFGESYVYKGLDYNLWCRGTREGVFSKLRKEVLTNICRRVVFLTSYNGDRRSFACTGYLIKWHKKGTHVILTSASLVRSPVDEDKIDEKLKIDVFFPPNQHATGKLELYHLDYNIAVISVQKRLRGTHPENIFHTEKPRKKVVAIGCEVNDGVLMGKTGVVAKKPYDKPSKLDCKDLELSTCKMKKVH